MRTLSWNSHSPNTFDAVGVAIDDLKSMSLFPYFEGLLMFRQVNVNIGAKTNLICQKIQVHEVPKIKRMQPSTRGKNHPLPSDILWGRSQEAIDRRKLLDHRRQSAALVSRLGALNQPALGPWVHPAQAMTMVLRRGFARDRYRFANQRP